LTTGKPGTALRAFAVWHPLGSADALAQPAHKVFQISGGYILIKVLGSGCANCHKVEALAHQALGQLGVEARVEIVTDVAEILRYGVMNTPGIVINDRVVSTGRVPALSQIKTLMADARAQDS
jgi:small redox-active disulfide protein 2